MIVCFPAIIHAQDWQCVREGVTAIYVDTSTLNQNTQHTAWVVHIDSVSMHQGWNYHYGFHQIRQISDTNNYPNGYESCCDANGPSRMGVAMSALGGENFFFNSAGQGIRISTLRLPGQPWICCGLSDTSLLYATVASMDVESILGEPDSVKYISFQAKSNAGMLLSHPLNSQVFVLSKHFGMITLYDFYSFPDYSTGYPLFSPVHLLAGIESDGSQKGDDNLSLKEVYMLAPGDIFHTVDGGSDPHYSPPKTEAISVVIDSTWNHNHDSITYTFSRFYHYFNGQPDGVHIYAKDTVSFSYPIFSDACPGFDNFPEQTGFCYDTSGTLRSVSSFSQYRGGSYNSRRVKIKGNTYLPYSFCSDTLVGMLKPYGESSNSSEYYIEGCGGKYYYYSYTNWYHDTHTTFYKLVYFKKGSETWGEPLDTTNWVIPHTIPENEHVRFILCPNPSNGLVTLEFSGSEKPDYRLVIFSISGIKISEMKIAESKFAFDVSNYAKGMYFLKLYKGNLQVGQQKLIKK